MPTKSFDLSKSKIAAATRYLPGGVSSNFRLGMAPTPLVIRKGEGPYVTDADDNRLIDYYLGMGPMILGHNPQSVIDAAKMQLEYGILFAGQTDVEFEAARLVCELVPCAQKVRFTSSGTEAIQAALRLARAATGRQTIVKFEGHYHGWLDNVLWSVAARENSGDSDEQPVKLVGSAGCDSHAGDNLDILSWNDLGSLVRRLELGDVAAVIMEPAMCNGGVIPPGEGYLAGVRAACTRTGTVLIFDEVITGFRLAVGGAQSMFGVTPDLAIFGKAIANGFPVAAIAGRSNLMEMFASGGVMHGGTYNAHPVNMAAAVATMRELSQGFVYPEIEKRGRRLMTGISDALAARGIPAQVQGFPAVFCVTFGVTMQIRRFHDTFASDRRRYARFALALIERGVRVLERGTWFVSAAHDDAVIDETLRAVDLAAAAVA
jgi:glutamate-1-semialdehyde 2,1-aminomutase